MSKLMEANAFELVAVASLRVKQLVNGCAPRVTGTHKATTTALLEVASGAVARMAESRAVAPQSHERRG